MQTADHDGILKKDQEQSMLKQHWSVRQKNTKPKSGELSPGGLLPSVCSMAAPMLTFLRRSSMAPLIYRAESYLWLRMGGPRAASRACLFLARVGGDETGGSTSKNHADVHHLFQTRT